MHKKENIVLFWQCFFVAIAWVNVATNDIPWYLFAIPAVFFWLLAMSD